jgi:predicted transposase YdaD
MDEARVRELVRHFRENGLKLLLQHPSNARDLLALAGWRLLDRIDFARMTVDPTTYIASDWRHVASDLVLHAPFRTRPGRRSRRWVTLYVLFEHQSEPDPVMMLRVLDYLVQIWKGQLRTWTQEHRSLAGFRLQPILPVVFYTGTRTWDELGRLVDLVEAGELFTDVTPEYRPLFVSLPALPAAALESAGGELGWVFELIQQRRARPEEFADLVRRVVGHLEALARADHNRWLELVAYIRAMVYHDRQAPEQDPLVEVIEDSVGSEERRREVRRMGQTIAEALEAKGRKKGRKEGRQEEAVRSRREMLLLLLRDRFRKVPKAIEQVVNATDDVARLTEWVRRVSSANTVEDVGITGER